MILRSLRSNVCSAPAGPLLSDNPGYGIEFNYSCGDCKIWNLVSAGNASGAVSVGNVEVTLYDAQMAEATKYADIGRTGEVASLKEGGAPDTHVITTYWGTITADGVTRHTASGISWKLSPTNAVLAPLRRRLASVAVQSGVPVIIGAWLRRDNTAIAGRIYIPGRQLAGIDEELSDAIGAQANIWELKQLSFTPSETGVLDLYVEAQGGTTYALWVDDLSVTV